jgi:hypothetical protein
MGFVGDINVQIIGLAIYEAISIYLQLSGLYTIPYSAFNELAFPFMTPKISISKGVGT